MRQRIDPHLLAWIAAKNVIYPGRRLIARYFHDRHARFDRRAGIRTAGPVSLRELGLSPETSVRYEASPIGFFHSLIHKLDIDYSRTVFIDLGSGKGRVLLLASHYPFRSIIGVEISLILCQIATDNIETYLTHRRRQCDISVVRRGIDEFDYPELGTANHLLIYMYNPCSESVLMTAVEKLSGSAAQGVLVTIIYLNPVWCEVLTKTPWLIQIRHGETFDETSNSFMPYVVFQGVPPPWKQANEVLRFQFGPWVFAKWRFPSVSNTTSPLREQLFNRPPVSQPIVYQQMRAVGLSGATLSLDGNAIRYMPYHGIRYFIDLSSGSFDSYLAKFSKKARYNLKRAVRQFEEHAGGRIDFRHYTSPKEMMEFYECATAVSNLAYQSKIGCGIPETDEFKHQLFREATEGRVCSFLLFHFNRPVAYALCRVEADIVTYTLVGYDPSFGKLSPGTVLLLLLIERLLAERRFALFDFGGTALDYKAFFATGSIDYVKVMWFPITAKYLILVLAHCLVLQASRAAARLKFCACTAGARIERHLPRLSAQIRRARAAVLASETPKQQAHQLRL